MTDRSTLETAVTIARAAGDLLLEYRQRADLRVDTKGRIDLVTEADLASEELVRDGLARAFPDDDVLAEELSDPAAALAMTGDPARRCWIVDPLDGTTNYVHGHPMYAVSIGLVRAGQVELGVIHAPVFDETFSALSGTGAWLNGEPMRVTSTERLIDSVVASGFPYRRAEIPDNNIANFGRVALEVRGIRRGGSAALDLAYVACGRFDAFWELHLSPWDVAAGVGLVRAAGGCVTDLDGGDDWLFGRNIVASNGVTHEALRGRLDPVVRD